jgi:hypothetical protein
LRSGCGFERASAPADACLASDAGAFLAFGGQDVAVTGVGVAPTEVGVQGARVCTVWLGWLELAMVNCRSGPKCASIGIAHEA